jgi:hypothetical protein
VAPTSAMSVPQTWPMMQPLQSWTWTPMSVSRSWQGGHTPSSVRVCLAWQNLVCAEQQSPWWVLGVLASGVVQQRFVYRSAEC